jgi:small subunit ribosomal protein S17
MSETQVNQDQPRKRKIKYGKVVSAKGEKTIIVAVDNQVRHPRYEKYIKRRTKLAVHDEKNLAKVGDEVSIVPTRRYSKNKAHRLVQVLRESVLTDHRA